jgi:hypothetical protein
MTRTTMTGMATILRWKDADGNYVFDVDEMVRFDTLPRMIDQLPLLNTYIKMISTVNQKGKITSNALATHSLTDVTRRLLQLVPLELMVFHAKQGHTRTDFWHGDYFRSNPLFTFHKVTIPGANDVFMGQCVVYRYATSANIPTTGLGLVDTIFQDEQTNETLCSLRRYGHDFVLVLISCLYSYHSRE